MTTETDKLVEMARESRATKSGTAPDELLTFSRRELAAFASAHIASLCGDVEPVAWLHKQGAHTEPSERELLEDEKERGWTQKPLYPASTVAALKAERDAALERVAVLEGVIDSVLLDIDDDGVAEARDIAVLAMRNIRNGRPQYEGLDALDAAPQPQQEQSK